MTSTPQAGAASACAGLQPSASGQHGVLLDGHPSHAVQGTLADHSSKPFTLSDLSPPKPNQHDALTLSDLLPSEQVPPANGTSREQVPNTSLVRSSRKRASNMMPTRESKKGRLASDAAPSTESSQAISKRGKDSHAGPAIKAISKPMPLAPSKTVNKVQARPHSQPVHTATSGHRLVSATYTRDLKGKAHGNSTATTRSRRDTDKEQHPPVNLTAPTGPVFAKDVYRQLALEKTQKEQEKRNSKAATLPHFSKPVNHFPSFSLRHS